VPGTVVEGIVESIMPYGAFVNIGNGISGLVHISQISQRRISSVHEVLKEGQKVQAKILNTNDGKVSLSMKALSDIMEKADEEEEAEAVEYSSNENTGTSLGDLLAKLKL
jgi:small subunit ribosomal protein S1